MKHKRMVPQMIVLTVVLLFLVACSTSQPTATYAPTPTPMPELTEVEFEIDSVNVLTMGDETFAKYILMTGVKVPSECHEVFINILAPNEQKEIEAVMIVLPMEDPEPGMDCGSGPVIQDGWSDIGSYEGGTYTVFVSSDPLVKGEVTRKTYDDGTYIVLINGEEVGSFTAPPPSE